MGNGVFNISKGSFVEKIRDSATVVEVLLLKVSEAEAALIDHDDIAALLAASNTEAAFASYARITGITGTITIDDTNNWVDVDIPDQTWLAATAGETMTKLITAYNQGAGDANLVPMTHHDFPVTTDGSDITAEIAAAGIARAQ